MSGLVIWAVISGVSLAVLGVLGLVSRQVSEEGRSNSNSNRE